MTAKTTIQRTQSGDLAERLRERIQSSRLTDGEFFMTEAELAEEYDVSRTVAREAVGRLVALGLLEGRKRKGLVVRRPDPLRLLELGLPSLLESQQDISELAKLRYVLEMGAVELAVRNATDEQISKLCELADELERSIRSGANDKTVELDVAFHSVLLQMTGSSLVAGMQRVLVQFFESAQLRWASGEGTDDRVIWEHQELAAAMRDRDLNQARAMIQMQARAWMVNAEPNDEEA